MIVRRSAIPAVFAVAVTTLAGCNAQPDADALYPLEPGLRWQYSVQTARKGSEPVRSTRVMENVERRYFAGEENVAIRRNENGARYYVAQREDGYYRVAVKSVARHTPIMDQPPTRILPLPAKVGATWREPAHAYLLDRATTFITEHAPENTITLDYRIEADDVSVEVPAGRFENCVLAVGAVTFHLGSGVGFAPSDVPIEQREWYCPGVGLARLERDERLTSEERFITGGHISMKLTRAPGRW
jgi:hypothetical protein